MSCSSQKSCDVTVKTEIIDVEDEEPRPISPAKKDSCKTLSQSQINELKAAFSMLDKNQDGRVEIQEMKEMLEGLGIYTDDTVVQSLIRKATQRDDGLVSEEEFLDWMASQNEIRDQDDDIMEDFLAAFRVFDKDGNGFITKDELKTAMDLIGEPVTEAQLDDMLKVTDTDNDGRINYEEFVKILL